MSFDPMSAVLIIFGSTPVLYLGWASLNCFCRKPQEAQETEEEKDVHSDQLIAPRRSFSRQVSSDPECISPGSVRSSIDSQLVSWERPGYVSEMGDEETASRAYE